MVRCPGFDYWRLLHVAFHSPLLLPHNIKYRNGWPHILYCTGQVPIPLLILTVLCLFIWGPLCNLPPCKILAWRIALAPHHPWQQSFTHNRPESHSQHSLLAARNLHTASDECCCNLGTRLWVDPLSSMIQLSPPSGFPQWQSDDAGQLGTPQMRS